MVATIVIFILSVLFRNASFYDAYWSVAPPVIAFWFVTLDSQAELTRALLVLTIVMLWALRLTANWAYGWAGMQHVDWRYQNLQAGSGRLWWLLSFAGVHLFPTLVVYAGCISLYPALVSGTEPLGWLDGVALLIGLVSVWLEFQADRQLHQFRRVRASRSEVLSTGVWAWCRHPNYLGEIGFWVCLFLFGWAANGGIYPWAWTGPVIMVALFVLISIPMIEKKLAADKPGYAEYRASTGMLLPKFR